MSKVQIAWRSDVNLVLKLTAAAAVAAGLGAGPAAADPGRGNGKDDRGRNEDRGDRRGPRVHYVADCPPGLAKKNPPCIPPGQARKPGFDYGTRVGDILRVGDYLVIPDPDRFRLEARRGWTYYRDDDRIYRVDSGTRQILAILNLIDAFAN